jgi:hypothetical protein
MNNDGLVNLQRIACSLSNLKCLATQTVPLATYSTSIRSKLQKESACLEKVIKIADESRTEVPLRISEQFLMEAAQIR